MSIIQEVFEDFAKNVLDDLSPKELDIARAIFAAGATAGCGRVAIKVLETALTVDQLDNASLSISNLAELVKTCREETTTEINSLSDMPPTHEEPLIQLLN